MEEKPENPGTEETPAKEEIFPANTEQDITSITQLDTTDTDTVPANIDGTSQPDATIANQLVADIPVQPAATGFTPPAVSMSHEEYAYFQKIKHEHRLLTICNVPL